MGVLVTTNRESMRTAAIDLATDARQTAAGYRIEGPTGTDESSTRRSDRNRPSIQVV
jgi:hypothetical protein